MLRAYIISLLLLSLLIIYCIIKTVKIDSPLSSPIRNLMLAGLLALISNTVLISVQSVLIGTIAYSCFIAIIDWVIYYLCQYIIVFSEHKRYSKAFKTTVAFVLIIDNIHSDIIIIHRINVVCTCINFIVAIIIIVIDININSMYHILYNTKYRNFILSLPLIN